MSKVGEVVEWNFAKIYTQKLFLNFIFTLKISFMSLSQILICCHLDYQYLKLFYGNQTIEFFSCDPFLLDEYISLMANLCLNQIWDTIHEYSGIVISG